jgi:hypothetical protein
MRNFARLLLVFGISQILTLVIAITATLVASEIYNCSHPISDPIARGDDLSGPLFASFLVCLLLLRCCR